MRYTFPAFTSFAHWPATAGVGDIKFGKGEKKKAKRDFDYIEKMDQMFDCMLHQPVDLLSIVKEIQHNAVVPTATTPSVAPDSSPASKYNRKFCEINDNIKFLWSRGNLPRDSMKHMITSTSGSRSRMRSLMCSATLWTTRGSSMHASKCVLFDYFR